MKTFKNEIIIICFEAGKLSASFLCKNWSTMSCLLRAFRSIEKGLGEKLRSLENMRFFLFENCRGSKKQSPKAYLPNFEKF